VDRIQGAWPFEGLRHRIRLTRLLRMATLLTADPDAAEDVYQETPAPAGHALVAGWTTPGRSARRGWMHKHRHRPGPRARKTPPPAELFAGYDRGDPAGRRPGDGGPISAPPLLAALGTLTLQQRTIVVLRYFDDPQRKNEVGRTPRHLARNRQEHRLPRGGAVCAPSPGSSPLFTTDHHQVKEQPCPGSTRTSCASSCHRGQPMTCTPHLGITHGIVRRQRPQGGLRNRAP